jgi:hypothetical protein
LQFFYCSNQSLDELKQYAANAKVLDRLIALLSAKVSVVQARSVAALTSFVENSGTLEFILVLTRC